MFAIAHPSGIFWQNSLALAALTVLGTTVSGPGNNNAFSVWRIEFVCSCRADGDSCSVKRLLRHPEGYLGEVADVKIKYQRVTTEKLVGCATVALASASIQRRAVVLHALDELVRNGRQDRLVLLRAVSGFPPYTLRDRNIHAAAIAVIGEDHTANLLAMHAPDTSSKQHAQVSRELSYHLHRILVDSDVYFAQAIRGCTEPQPELVAGGYEKLSELEYASKFPRKDWGVEFERPGNIFRGIPEHQKSPAAVADSAFREVKLISYRNLYSKLPPLVAEARFEELLRRTFAGSLDCPKMNSYQTASDAIRSYRCLLGHDPDWWYVAVDKARREVGVLLLTPRHLSGILEITYLGVIPEHRGHGIGNDLLRFSLHRSWEGHFTQIVLAFDSRNAPARELYKKHGFEFLFRESVWGVSPGKMIETCQIPDSRLSAA